MGTAGPAPAGPAPADPGREDAAEGEEAGAGVDCSAEPPEGVAAAAPDAALPGRPPLGAGSNVAPPWSGDDSPTGEEADPDDAADPDDEELLGLLLAGLDAGEDEGVPVAAALLGAAVDEPPIAVAKVPRAPGVSRGPVAETGWLAAEVSVPDSGGDAAAEVPESLDDPDEEEDPDESDEPEESPELSEESPEDPPEEPESEPSDPLSLSSEPPCFFVGAEKATDRDAVSVGVSCAVSKSNWESGDE